MCTDTLEDPEVDSIDREVDFQRIPGARWRLTSFGPHEDAVTVARKSLRRTRRRLKGQNDWPKPEYFGLSQKDCTFWRGLGLVVWDTRTDSMGRLLHPGKCDLVPR